MFVIKKTHSSIKLYLNRSPLLWVERSNLGTYIHIDHTSPVSCNIEKFYDQFKFNSILSVLGKYSHEMATLHLVKS